MAVTPCAEVNLPISKCESPSYVRTSSPPSTPLQVPNGAWTNFLVETLNFSDFDVGVVNIGSQVKDLAAAVVKVHVSASWRDAHKGTMGSSAAFRTFLRVVFEIFKAAFCPPTSSPQSENARDPIMLAFGAVAKPSSVLPRDCRCCCPPSSNCGQVIGVLGGRYPRKTPLG